MVEPQLSISVVIVTWNGKDLLAECLASLEAVYDFEQCEVIVVDNGSTDGTVKWIQQHCSYVRLVCSESNLGYAEGNNLGAQHATGELLFFLNNDTIVDRRVLRALREGFAGTPQMGAAQAKLIRADNNRLDGTGSFFLRTGFLYHARYNAIDDPKIVKHDILSAKGAALAIRRDIFERVSGFDPDYFAYLEETDLCWRVWLVGYRVCFLPSAVVVHRGGATASKLPTPLITFHSFKNRIATLLKNLDTCSTLQILPIHLLLVMGASVGFLVRRQPGNTLAIWRAIFWVLSHAGSLREKRQRINRLRQCCEESFLPPLTRCATLSYYYHLFVDGNFAQESW